MTCRRLARFLIVLTFTLPALGCPPDRPVCAPTAPYRLPPRRSDAGPCTSHQIALFRHAEKGATKGPDDRDPDLSPRGHDRAARISKLLARALITRLIASDAKRTQQTLAPLADRLGKPVDVVPGARTEELVRELRDAPPGSFTVVASHSNVVPLVVTALGGAPLRDLGPDGSLGEDDYGRMFLMTVGCSEAPVIVEITSD